MIPQFKFMAIQSLRRLLVPLPLMGGLAAALAVACGSGSTGLPAESSGSRTSPPILQSNQVLNEGEIKPILATTQLRVGTQRVSFLLATAQTLVKAPVANVTSVFLGDGRAPGEVKQANFHLWPYGVRGAYSTELTFGRPGTWRLDIEVEGPDGPGQAQVEIEVAKELFIPDVGTVPPLNPNKTLYTVNTIEELSTDYTPDPGLYQMTIAESVISGRPSVIVFATPAFCTSPTCGPQVDTVSELRELHQGEANFIHVELYDNPEEIQGDLSKAVYHKLVDVWGLSSNPHWFNESWTFLLGKDGRIAQWFEGFVSLEELDAALQAELEKA